MLPMKAIKLFFVCLFLNVSAKAQDYILDSIKEVHSFIAYDSNRIKFAEESPNFKRLYHTLDLIRQGYERKLHIFHIGGSHIQADLYPDRLRSYFQNMSPSAKGARSFLFPYKLAEAYNPRNFYVSYTGRWTGYRCSKRDTIAWGLSGISAKCKDTLATVQIHANHTNYTASPYSFDRVRVFYDTWTDDYEVSLPDSIGYCSSQINHQGQYIEFRLSQSIKEISFNIRQIKDTIGAQFVLMGVELMNDDKGIEYTSIGVNGASFVSYEKCRHFYRQMAVYQPDLFIISIGTNDTYTTNFNADKYKDSYRYMIDQILKINPDCAILLTVPNDSYYRKRYANPFTKDAETVIYELAKEYKMAVWDFYEIMGGLKSSYAWYRQKLMPSDRIHFSKTGYDIKADLLLEAIAHSMEEVLQLPKDTVLKQMIHE